MRLLLIAGLIPFCLLGQASPPVGSITGVVLDENGKPVAMGLVHVERTDVPPRRTVSQIYDVVDTDAQGRFIHRNLAFGSYDVYAMKEKAGYPDIANHRFYQTGDGLQPLKTILTPDRPVADVTVRMSPKLGRIYSVYVADAVTKQPITVTDPNSGKLLEIPYVTLTWTDRNGQPAMLGGSRALTDTTLLFPINTPVTIRVGAVGYADWYYPGTPDRVKAQPVSLQSGEILSFNAFLQPLAETPAPGGTVTGVVVDEDGKPMPLARLRLIESTQHPANVEKTISCDANGRFEFDDVKWGTYTVEAMKPEAGYPDPFVAVYRFGLPEQKVTVLPTQKVADLRVPLLPKAGRLRLSVVNATNGIPLDHAVIILHRRDMNPTALVKMADGVILIPSNASVVLQVHVNGFSERLGGQELLLHPGEEVSLTVRMIPLGGMF